MALSAKSKGSIIVISTLLVGMVLGALGMGWFTRSRLRHVPNPRIFVDITERIIKPRDEAQREQIREILQGAMPRFRQVDELHREELRALMDSVHIELKPHLDAEQWARLDNSQKRFREIMRPRRGWPHRGERGGREWKGERGERRNREKSDR